MRNIICLFAVIAIMMSCSQPVEVVEANGFSPRGNEIKMGLQESVDLMIEFDKFWKAKDYDSMKTLLSDSLYVEFAENSESTDTADKFIEALKDNPNQYDWTMTWAFSIKDDNPEFQGEFVNMGFDVSKTDENGNVTNHRYNDWAWINNGKIQWYSMLKRDM